jgi:hypothetical protein
MGLLIDGARVKAERLSQDKGTEGLEIEFSIGSRVIDTWKKHHGVRVTCMGCNRVPLTRRLIAIVVTLLVVTHHRDIVPIEMIINIHKED